MSYNAQFKKKKKNPYVNDVLVYMHKFIVVVCVFLIYVYSLTLIFEKCIKN